VIHLPEERLKKEVCNVVRRYPTNHHVTIYKTGYGDDVFEWLFDRFNKDCNCSFRVTTRDKSELDIDYDPKYPVIRVKNRYFTGVPTGTVFEEFIKFLTIFPEGEKLDFLNGKILLLLTADRCPYCAYALDTMIELVPEGCKFILAEINGVMDIIERFGIRSVPTILVGDSIKNIKIAFRGYSSRKLMINELRNAVES